MDRQRIKFPYGRCEIEIEIPSENFIGVLKSIDPPGVNDQRAEIDRSLKEPIGTETMGRMVSPGDKIALIISDKSRPVPNNVIVASLLDVLEKEKVARRNIKIIVALGMHQKMSENEIISMLGADIVKSYDVRNHDCFDKDGLTFIGSTPDGTKVKINNLVAEADFVISTGYIEPHEFAGFTGGRKSIFPGVSGIEAIKWNHRIEMLENRNAKPGILDNNPIHEDMLNACGMVGLDYIVNVVLNSRNEIARCFSGDYKKAHEAGVAFFKKYSKIEVSEKADIVITSLGYPTNRDLYQSLKAVFAVEPLIKDGGCIILPAQCEDGLGPDLFEEWMTSVSFSEEFTSKIEQEGYSPKIDHCYLLAKILKKASIIVVSSHPRVKEIDFLESVCDIEQALSIAFQRMGKDAKIIATPYSTRLLVSDRDRNDEERIGS